MTHKHRQPSPAVVYYIEPQRSGQYGWEECMTHRASRFTIIREKRSRAANGQVYKTKTRLNSFTKLAEAEAVLARVKAVASPGKGPATPSLGARFVSTGRRIIAASLPASHPLSHSNRANLKKDS